MQPHRNLISNSKNQMRALRCCWLFSCPPQGQAAVGRDHKHARRGAPRPVHPGGGRSRPQSSWRTLSRQQTGPAPRLHRAGRSNNPIDRGLTFAPDWRPFWTDGPGFINQVFGRPSGQFGKPRTFGRRNRLNSDDRVRRFKCAEKKCFPISAIPHARRNPGENGPIVNASACLVS